ncbi:MAG: aldolase/citrate lyase family protein [Bryobacteraceae bacterium]
MDRIVTFGAWVQIAHPASAEIFGRLGFDWICVDLEHGAIDIDSLADIFRAAESHGSVPLARLPYADTIWIKRTLDAGARGLIIPMVTSAEQAEASVRQAKYPPRGERGFGYSRANLHGIDFERYIKDANDEIAVVMQIEHYQGIAAIDSILDIEGVDAAFIGPLDLSGSFGKTGQLDCTEMVEALSVFRRACAAHGKAAGMHLVHPGTDSVDRAIRDGYSMIALGLDNVFLTTAARQALDAGQAALSAAAANARL